MQRINTLPLQADIASLLVAQGVGINPVDRTGYSRINTLPTNPSFTHKHSTFRELSTHKHSTQKAAKLGGARDCGRFLYVGLPVSIKEPVCAIASLWKAAKAPYHIGLGLSASYIHSRKVKTERTNQNGQGIKGLEGSAINCKKGTR